jgi:cellulose synthase/poly-beta-1,6-N-acetylglucosamine synthase-like glycosyltransferase
LETSISRPHRGLVDTEIYPTASREKESVLVSVVIPAYRCAQYIVQGIDSVLNQSFSNHEILVVNDGSPDTA